jgi:hypothetical protein
VPWRRGSVGSGPSGLLGCRESEWSVCSANRVVSCGLRGLVPYAGSAKNSTSGTTEWFGEWHCGWQVTEWSLCWSGLSGLLLLDKRSNKAEWLESGERGASRWSAAKTDKWSGGDVGLQLTEWSSMLEQQEWSAVLARCC